MKEFFGSQFGIIFFLILGYIVVYAINSFSKKDMSEQSADTIVNGCGCVGIIVVILIILSYIFS